MNTNYRILESIMPKILLELQTIEQAMKRACDLIFPHAWIDDKSDPFTIFSQEFAVYSECLSYEGNKLRELFMSDVQFWEELKQKATDLKSLSPIKEEEKHHAISLGQSTDLSMKRTVVNSDHLATSMSSSNWPGENDTNNHYSPFKDLRITRVTCSPNQFRCTKLLGKQT